MRRPILLILFISIIISLVYTKNYKDKFYDIEDKYIKVEGIVKNAIYKEYYYEYGVGNFLIRDFNKTQKINIGEYIYVKGIFKSSYNMMVDEFNYGMYLKSRGVDGIINSEYIRSCKSHNIYSYIKKVRTSLEYSTENIFRENSSFINALILGDKSKLDINIKKAFSRAGVSHIIALSGLHIGILIYIITLIIGRIKSLLKFFIISLLICLYSFIVGFRGSMFRACIFSFIIYLSVFVQREYDGISTLSFVGIILFIINPFIIYDIGVQLSFLATISIIYFYNKIDKYIRCPLISTTLSASILTIPVVYYKFNIISNIFLISNILIVPTVGILIGLIFMCIISYYINFNIIYLMLSKIVSFIILYIKSIVFYLSNMKYSYIEFETVRLKLVVLYYILLMAYMIYSERKTVKEQINEVRGYN
ncbi:ComEC/Rec2 family competence protein [Tepidibacter aestuarii]|uniref:ComEC/Rec2 family competence protein n=1 Tax=Tepidibacter aestuarii TaxID=2925782 RepID=UPI0020BEF6DF|nr:ComEC/Rec2 family competence protein [Tepidibacter aestuarii]CAH2214144.1 competence protein ComEC [Tepidibacter aestuarii]